MTEEGLPVERRVDGTQRARVLDGPASDKRHGPLPIVLGVVMLLILVAIVALVAVIIQRAVTRAERVRAAEAVSRASQVTSPATRIGVREAVAINDEATWLGPDDYPPEAIRAEQEGAVRVAWTIGIDGRIRDCHVTESSGVASLDAAPCRGLVRRARYQPATDASGKPIATTKTRRVVWRLPE